jgi:hypothetical protein
LDWEFAEQSAGCGFLAGDSIFEPVAKQMLVPFLSRIHAYTTGMENATKRRPADEGRKGIRDARRDKLLWLPCTTDVVRRPNQLGELRHKFRRALSHSSWENLKARTIMTDHLRYLSVKARRA